MVTLNKIGQKQFRLLSRNGFDVKIKEWKIYCCDLALWSEQNLNMDFTWSFGRIQQHIAPNSVSHVLHDCFPHSTNHIIYLWRCFCHLKHCVTSYMHWLCVASRTSLAYFPLCRLSLRSRRRQVLLQMWSANTFSLLNQTVIMAENRGRRKVLIAVDGSEHGDRAFDCKLMIYIFRKIYWQLFHFKFPRALFTFHARISVRNSKNRSSSQRESTVVGSLTEKKIFTDRAVGSSISCLWTQTCRTCRKQTPRDCKLNISWSLRSHKKAKRK